MLFYKQESMYSGKLKYGKVSYVLLTMRRRESNKASSWNSHVQWWQVQQRR